MPNRVISFLFLFLLLFPHAPFCQSGIPSVLKELLKTRINAISSKDTSALSSLCTKNYQAINSAGVKMTLSELKASVMKTETPIKQSTILSYQPFIAEDESMAFATFEIEEEIVRDKQNVSKNSLIITEIYKKEKNRWRIQLTHSSEKVCPVIR